MSDFYHDADPVRDPEPKPKNQVCTAGPLSCGAAANPLVNLFGDQSKFFNAIFKDHASREPAEGDVMAMGERCLMYLNKEWVSVRACSKCIPGRPGWERA